MKRRIDRMLTLITAAVFVTAAWSLAAHTPWGASRDFLGAGTDYTAWWEPLTDLAGMVLLAVVATRLIERVHGMFRPSRTPRVAVAAAGRSGRVPVAGR